MACSIDDSDGFIYSQTRIPDANVLAGVIIPENEIKTLINIIAEIKNNYGLKGRPMKYNNRGSVKDYYATINKPELYQILTKNQKAIQEEIIKKSAGIPYYIVVSWRMCSGDTKKNTNEKGQNISNSFLDILNTSIQYLPEFKDAKFELILDRFPKGDLESILEDTYSIWKEPQLSKGLEKSFPSFGYGVTLENELLQFTDILAGMFKDLIQYSIKNKPIISSNYTYLIPKLAGYPNKVPGVGLIGPSQDQKKLVKTIRNLHDRNSSLISLFE